MLRRTSGASTANVNGIAAISAGLGLAVYFWLSFYFPIGDQYYFGTLIYDSYYNRILEGRLDLPLRIMVYEGHYLPDGTAFTYHGLAPLLLRFAAGWLLPTDGTVFPYLSAPFWSALGSACYHFIFHHALSSADKNKQVPKLIYLMVGLLSWFATPGIFLAGNSSFYIEPIAVSYAMTGFFFLSIYMFGNEKISYRSALIFCAFVVAINIHARPHIALALGLGLSVFCIYLLRVYGKRAIHIMVMAALIPGLSASGYLYVNYLKFGDPLIMHGGFDEDSPVKYGTVFLGLEEFGSDKARGFEENGRFNPARIPGNLLVYVTAFPTDSTIAFSESILAVQSRYAGFSVLEGPHHGIVFLWLSWLAIAFGGLKRPTDLSQRALLVSGSLVAMATLSYATVTFRYRAELWPFVAAIVLIGISGYVDKARYKSLVGETLLISSLAVTGIMNAIATWEFEYWLKRSPDSFVWDRDYCMEVVTRSFEVETASALCADLKTW